MQTSGFKRSNLHDAVIFAIETLEAERVIDVWMCGSQNQADHVHDAYPDRDRMVVTFQPWQIPTDYMGNVGLMNARASEEGGRLVDCYQLTDGVDEFAYNVPWCKSPVGTVRPGAVYDFLGIARMGEWSEAMLDGLIINPILKAAELNDGEWSEDQAQRVQGAFNQYAKQNRQISIDRANQRLQETQVEISQYRQALGQSVIKLMERQQRVIELDNGDERGDRLVREYELLAEHPRVARLGFIGTSLRITTTDDLRLWSTDRTVSRWLGRFLITIDLANCDVKLKNLDTARGGSDHPHVTDGVVCWGEYEQRVAEMVGRGDLLTLFEWLLQFLETYNPSDYYSRYARWWLDAPDERPLEGEVIASVVA
jgi:hypothetical protein